MTPVAERLLAQRQAQGLPPKVTDPTALARVAAILTARGGERHATDAA